MDPKNWRRSLWDKLCQQRTIVDQLAPDVLIRSEYPVKTVCGVIGLAPSSYYCKAKTEADVELEQALLAKAAEWPLYGSRRLTEALRRDEWIVNRKRVQRLMRKHHRVGKPRRQQGFTTVSRHGFERYENLVKDLEIEQPDQVWVADLTYIKLGQGLVYLAVLMDVYTRVIRGWALSRDIDTDLTLAALDMALEDHVPEVHHSDQGVQSAATAYVQVLKPKGIAISMAAVGAPEENGYAERLIRTIKTVAEG